MSTEQQTGSDLLEISSQSRSATTEIKAKLAEKKISLIEGDSVIYVEKKELDNIEKTPEVNEALRNVQVREANTISSGKPENKAFALFNLFQKDQALERVVTEASELQNTRGFITAKIQQLENQLAIDAEARKQLENSKKYLREEFHADYVELFGKISKKDFPEKFENLHSLAPQQKIEATEEIASLKEQLKSFQALDIQPQSAAPEKANTAQAELKREQESENDASEKDVPVVPHHLRNTYFYAREKIFETGSNPKHVFTDQGNRIIVHEKEPVSSQVQHLVDFAEGKQWPSIKVTGTTEFKRQVWLEAKLRNINVEGYSPSKTELAQLDALMAKKEKKEQKESPQVTPENSIEKGSGRENQSATASQNENFAREKKERSFYGKLIENGEAPYDFKDGNKTSPYARLVLGSGEQHIVWGVDLPRALTAAKANIGDMLLLVDTGKKPVEIQEEIKDANGNVIGHKPKIVDRHVWTAEIKEAEASPENRKEKVLSLFDQARTPKELLEISKSNPQYSELRKAAALYHLEVDRNHKNNTATRQELRSSLESGKDIDIKIVEKKTQVNAKKSTKSLNKQEGLSK